MQTTTAAARAVLALVVVSLFAACDVRVGRSDRHRDTGRSRDADLDVRTPLGDLTVRKDVDADRVGLAHLRGCSAAA
jgi:hypothetical protein